MSLRYAPHIVYSLALTSISMHMLFQRRIAQEDRSQISAKISILESLVDRFGQGEQIDRKELLRLRKLAGVLDPQTSENTYGDSKTEWKDVVLGRKEQVVVSGWDQKDWEKGRSICAPLSNDLGLIQL